MRRPAQVAGPIVAVVAWVVVGIWMFWPHLVAVLAADPSEGSIAIRDVAKAETLKMGGQLGLGNTHQLTIHVSGVVDGTATISNPLALPGESPATISGAVELRWSGDFYSDAAEIRYSPQDVRGGNLAVTYQFHRVPGVSPSR